MKKSLWQKYNNLKEFDSIKEDKQADVLIIGAGLTGITLAYNLINSNMNVILIDMKKCFDDTISKSTGKIAYLQELKYQDIMSVYDFDRVIDRRGTNCAKFDAAETHGYSPDILPLWVADMDFQAPPCVLEALNRAIEHGIFGYPITGRGYYDAVIRWFDTHFGWKIQKDWLIQTPGVVFALSAAVRAATVPGDAVLVQPPVYYPFYNVILQNERKVVESPLVFENGRYSIDFADVEAKIVENSVKLFILCSPHNPVCRVWTVEELARLGAICKSHGVTVISDEIHCDFAFPEHPHTPLRQGLSRAGRADHYLHRPQQEF